MYGCLLLLALAISPSAPQQQTKTVEQVWTRIDGLSEVLLDVRVKLVTYQDNIREEAAEVKEQNEQILVDILKG